MRRIFVGDIQGCREPLEQLLAATEFRRGVDQLCPVGDMVNKGPDSVGVLRLMVELDATAVLGNHDLLWLGRQPTVDADLANWLRSQPYVRIMNDLIMVHAGLHPNWTEADLLHLSDEQIEFATNVRYCDAAGNRPVADWPPPAAPFRPWHEFYRGAKKVVFGHWARQGLFRGDRVLGLDTGCVYGNQLTAWIAEEDRIVQV